MEVREIEAEGQARRLVPRCALLLSFFLSKARFFKLPVVLLGSVDLPCQQTTSPPAIKFPCMQSPQPIPLVRLKQFPDLMSNYHRELESHIPDSARDKSCWFLPLGRACTLHIELTFTQYTEDTSKTITEIKEH